MADTGTHAGTALLRFNRPELVGNELEYMAEAVASGHTSARGPFTEKVSALLAEEAGAATALLTTSCTDALEMSAMLLDIEPGDVVIVPSFTFVSTALAFVREGARIRFCDIEPDTLGLDPQHLATLLDERVRAVVPVHYAGVGCRIDEIIAVIDAARSAGSTHPSGVTLIEDNAHGLFGRFRDEPLGSFGRFATLSFHETKNFICGEGGALIVNDERDVERANMLMDKGTDRRAFASGLVDKYSWRDRGSSFGLSDLLAAYLLGQLEERTSVLDRRRAAFERYDHLLTPLVDRFGLVRPITPEHCESAFHMYYVLLPEAVDRNAVLHHMSEAGVRAAFHYVPLHSSDGGQMFGDGTHDCPVTNDISARLVRLPFFNALDDAEAERVIAALDGALQAADR